MFLRVNLFNDTKGIKKDHYNNYSKRNTYLLVRNQMNQSTFDAANTKPQELTCLICDKIMTDPVVIPCCGKSYCKECTYYYYCCCSLFAIKIILYYLEGENKIYLNNQISAPVFLSYSSSFFLSFCRHYFYTGKNKSLPLLQPRRHECGATHSKQNVKTGNRSLFRGTVQETTRAYGHRHGAKSS